MAVEFQSTRTGVMQLWMRRLLRGTRGAILAMAAFLFLAAQAVAAPKEADLRAFVETSLGPGLSLQDLRYKVFSDSSGQGRVSVAGSLKATEPRYRSEQVQNARFRAELQALGMSDAQILRYGKATGVSGDWGQIKVFMEQAVAVGTSIPFKAEIVFLETVDGFDLRGNLVFDVCCTPLSALNPQTEIPYDGDVYRQYVLAMQGWLQHEREIVPAAVLQVFGGFREGAILLEDGRAVAVMEPFDPSAIGWRIESRLNGFGRYRDTYVAEAETRIRPLDGSARKIAWSDLIPGESAPITVRMGIDFFTPNDSLACVSLGFKNGGTAASCFQDGAFSRPDGQYGGILDNERQVYYALRPGSPDAAVEAVVAEQRAAEQAAAEAAAARAAEAQAHQSVLEGDWMLPGYDAHTITIDGLIAVLTTAGPGWLPAGSEILRIESFDGVTLTGQISDNRGGFQPATARLDGNRLDFESGGMRWQWVRRQTPEQIPMVISALDGQWESTSRAGFVVEMDNGVGTILSGGFASVPDGIDLIRLDTIDGNTFRGRQRFSDGNWHEVVVSADSVLMKFAGGGYSWEYRRQ